MVSEMIVQAEGEGHTLLCLHGIGGGAHWFRGLGLRLKNQCKVVALDLPGTGMNRALCPRYTIEGAVDVLAQWIRQEDRPVSILGHSMGTILALKLHTLLPERIRSLLLVGGLPSVLPHIRTRLSERKDLLLRQGKAGLGWKVAEGVFSKTSIRETPEIVALFARHWEEQPLDEYVESIDALLGASADSLVGQVKTPTLVLAGADDSYAPPEKVGIFAASLPGLVRRVELAGRGHMTFLEAPEAFGREVADFMSAMG
jgi:pimeloyl-ACP methyl ester carboxylesterase